MALVYKTSSPSQEQYQIFKENSKFSQIWDRHKKGSSSKSGGSVRNEADFSGVDGVHDIKLNRRVRRDRRGSNLRGKIYVLLSALRVLK